MDRHSACRLDDANAPVGKPAGVAKCEGEMLRVGRRRQRFRDNA